MNRPLPLPDPQDSPRVPTGEESAQLFSEANVTQILFRLRSGDPQAVGELWRLVIAPMTRRAKQRLGGHPLAAADEEDVALSAFKSFCLGLERGEFTEVLSRRQLWPMLAALTTYKTVDLIRGETRLKRGGGGPAPVSLSSGAGSQEQSFPEPESPLVQPAELAAAHEECARLMGLLQDAVLRTIVEWKLAGWTHEEIAAKLDCAPRTVERKLKLIRSLWAEDLST